MTRRSGPLIVTFDDEPEAEIRLIRRMQDIDVRLIAPLEVSLKRDAGVYLRRPTWPERPRLNVFLPPVYEQPQLVPSAPRVAMTQPAVWIWLAVLTAATLYLHFRPL